MVSLNKYLRILLWLIALHSLIAGLLLITLGNKGIMIFGFDSGNPFFQVQGGVFHLVMCVAYVLAAFDTNNRKLIIFIILAKSIALIYLLVYYFIIDPVITILFSGLADGLMALFVWLLWKARMKEVA